MKIPTRLETDTIMRKLEREGKVTRCPNCNLWIAKGEPCRKCRSRTP